MNALESEFLEYTKISVVVDEISRDIFSRSGACKCIFQQSRVTNFRVFEIYTQFNKSLT